MMRINSVKKRIRDEHIADIQRRYPLVANTSWPTSLTENRKRLWDSENPSYRLIQEPIIECIPQYIRDQIKGDISRLHENSDLSEDIRSRLEVIIPTLEASMFEGCFLSINMRFEI